MSISTPFKSAACDIKRGVRSRHRFMLGWSAEMTFPFAEKAQVAAQDLHVFADHGSWGCRSWYTKLFGRGPDNRPMGTLVQWELFSQAGVGISTDDEIARRGAIFLIVDDVAAERERLRGVGIVLSEDIPGDYSTLAQVRDPDGNLITLATPPSPNYPSA